MVDRNRLMPISWVLAGLLVGAIEAGAADRWGALARETRPLAPSSACRAVSTGVAPVVGILEIDAATPGATLRLDGGAPVAAAGFRCPLAAGDHEIEISAPGYGTLRQRVRVTGGGVVHLRPWLIRSSGGLLAPPGGETGGVTPLPGILATTRGPPTTIAALPRRPPGSRSFAADNVPRPLPKPPAPPLAAAATVAADAAAPKLFDSPPAAPHPVAPPGDPTRLFRTVQDAFDALVPAHVAFNAPRRMKRGEPRVIEARLAIDLPPEVLVEQITEADDKVVRRLRVGPRMIAALSGGAAFDVSPVAPRQQYVGYRQPTVWTWQVTPNKSGTHNLILTFDAVLSLDGKEVPYSVQTLKHEIEVQVGWGAWLKDGLGWLKDGLGWLKGVIEYLAWLWITILVPIGLWTWPRVGKRLWRAARRRPRPTRGRRVAAAGRARAPDTEFEFTTKGIPFVGGAAVDSTPPALLLPEADHPVLAAAGRGLRAPDTSRPAGCSA